MVDNQLLADYARRRNGEDETGPFDAVATRNCCRSARTGDLRCGYSILVQAADSALGW